MDLGVLGARSLSLFEAVGGWRTVAESVASRVLFLVAFLLSGDVPVAAAIAVGAAIVLAAARLWAGRRPWPVLFALATIAVSALLAGRSGHPVDFYLPGVIVQPILCAGVLASMLLRRPLVGVAVEAARGRRGRRRWHRDPERRGRYQRCTAVFLVKDLVGTAVLVPLYLTGALLPLGVAVTVFTGPLSGGACAYLCWRILQRPYSTPTTRQVAPT